MKNLKFNGDGLIPAIIQDADSGEVLMLAYMDVHSVQKTFQQGKTVFYSRSRKEYWVKGETSGHTQDVIQVLTDCDKDTLLIRVKQKGGACHLGYRSCFVHQIDQEGNVVQVTQAKIFDPDKIYSPKPKS